MLLAALANTLMHRLRALARQATELERASTATIRVRLLKIGAAILRNTRRVRVMLASHHPLRELFATAEGNLAKLSASPENFIQCLARALTANRPASQAGEGVDTSAKRRLMRPRRAIATTRARLLKKPGNTNRRRPSGADVVKHPDWHPCGFPVDPSGVRVPPGGHLPVPGSRWKTR
jgi:Transposase DDE domain group 1